MFLLLAVRRLTIRSALRFRRNDFSAPHAQEGRSMRFLKSVSIAAATLIGSGLVTPAQAGPITVLSQTYEIHGGTLVTSVNQTSSTGPVSANIDDGPFGFVSLLSDGIVGSSTGFLITDVLAACFECGGEASASMDFLTTSPTSLNLTTSGGYLVGAALSGIRLTNLTDQLVLLNFSGVPGNGFYDLTSSFFFSLDSSKQYRLEAWAETAGADAARSQVEFNVAVPEPSTLSLLLSSVSVLGFVRRKRKEARPLEPQGR